MFVETCCNANDVSQKKKAQSRGIVLLRLRTRMKRRRSNSNEQWHRWNNRSTNKALQQRTPCPPPPTHPTHTLPLSTLPMEWSAQKKMDGSGYFYSQKSLLLILMQPPITGFFTKKKKKKKKTQLITYAIMKWCKMFDANLNHLYHK